MDQTMLIKVTNEKAVGLLHELEELRLIKVLKENVRPSKLRFSSKYKGIITKEKGKSLSKHVKQMRN
ncbi:MAG: hypothetical protein K2U26_05910, partial [Cyclobacteriaceae bacterium]|nr:hypothetical protein [Cyclobacteriaceae bacterium]